MKLSTFFDHWILYEYRQPPAGLAFYRIFYVLLTLLFKGSPIYLWLATMPAYLYNPPRFSLGAFFTGFPPYWVCFALTMGVAILYVALLFGYRTSITGIALFSLLLIGNSFTYSFGKIDHDKLFAMLLPLVMAFSNWGSCYSLDEANRGQSKGEGWPIALLALLFGFAMFSAGVPKYWSGWLNPSSSAVQGYVFSRYYALNNHDYLATFFVHFQYPIFWEVLDYATVFFELGFFLALFRRRWFQRFLIIAVFFHLANFLILNISFAANLFFYLLFINWQPIVDFVQSSAKVKRILQILRSHLAFSIALLLQISFVLFRIFNYANPNVLENSAGDVTRTLPVVSLLDFVLHSLHTQFDVNLLLLVTAASLVCLFFLHALLRSLWNHLSSTLDEHGALNGRRKILR